MSWSRRIVELHIVIVNPPATRRNSTPALASMMSNTKLGSLSIERRAGKKKYGSTKQISAIKSCMNQKADLEALPL
jgi:hypothetical protein